ncbi:MAG: hypothetical protein KKF41_08120 [Actinobacteria bacterium]|nr:hypothetical protein [Actinomycetota bacterium]MBU1944060.1 hypothetical protein [Actinomycetota bacterium]MBU2687537.1 hypothetical protein [Actinomycetota bacterium]
MPEVEVGKVAHFFNKIGVAAINLSGDLSVGDMIHIKGHTSDWTQTVESMQIEHDQVEKAGAGESVGIRVPEHAHEHDVVFKVTD